MAKTFARFLYLFALSLVPCLVAGAFAQGSGWFAQGNLVVAVSGCGVYGSGAPTDPSGGTCPQSGQTGYYGGIVGTGVSGTYGDDQAAPWNLFQFSCPSASGPGTSTSSCLDPSSLSVTYINVLGLPQNISGANYPISNDYGSQSEGTIQLSGNRGVYLTMLGIGISALEFNNNASLFCESYTGTFPAPATNGLCDPENGNPAAAQSVSLLGYSPIVAVPRVAALIDASGNVNSSTVLYNIFDQNDPRSALSPDGINIYVSGQGCKSCDNGVNPNQGWYDNTAGVYYTQVGVNNYNNANQPVAITGPDNGPASGTSGTNLTSNCTTTSSPPCNSSISTRMLQIYDGTLYVSQDDKPGSSGGGDGGSGYNRSYIGTLGDPPATSLYTCTSVGGGCPSSKGPYGPSLLTGFGNSGGTGKQTITAGGNGNNLNGNSLNVITVTCTVKNTTTLTCPVGTFSSGDVGDTVSGANIPAGTTISTYTSSSAVKMSNDGTASSSGTSESVSIGLQINLSPQNFFFASPSVLYVADTGSPKNDSNGPDDICVTENGGTIISGTLTSGSETVTATSGTFTQADVGLSISGTGIPSGTTITGYTSSTVATMSAEATSAETGESIIIGYTGSATAGNGGLQKWVNSQSNGSGTWSLAYTLYQGLDLTLNAKCNPNSPQSPGAANAATGLYGLAGVVNNGVATLYATSYPNDDLVQSYLWAINDTLTTATYPATTFTLLSTAPPGSLYRGVSFAPTIPAGNIEITATVSGAAAGLTLTSAGSNCSASTFTTPSTLNWTSASSCTLSTQSPQAQAGVQYVFSSWGDGTTNPQSDVINNSPNPFPTTYNATFTALAQGIYSPVNGSTLTSTSVTFQWGGYPGATAFWLDVGSTSGGNNYYSSGSLSNSTFSQSVSNLPNNGGTVYATWYYMLNGSWVANSSSYPALNASGEQGVLTTPAPAATAPYTTLPGSTVTFGWTAGSPGPYSYWVDIGSAAGENNYYSSGNLGNVTTTTASGLPINNSLVYVTLYTLIGGQWYGNGYTYNALNESAAQGVLTTPAPTATPPYATLPGSTVTFGWTAGSPGPYSYWVDIGSTQGGNNYYSSGNLGNVTSTTVSGLPTDGSNVYVTLYTLVDGQWYGNQYTYAALNAAAAEGVLTQPTPGSTLPGSTVTFDWTAGSPGPYSYWVDIGSTQGGNNYYSSGNLGNVTSTTASGWPSDGSNVYVTLYTLIDGQWYGNGYMYSAPAP